MVKYYADPNLVIESINDEDLSEVFDRLKIELISKYQREEDNVLKSSFHICAEIDTIEILKKELEAKSYLIIFED